MSPLSFEKRLEQPPSHGAAQDTLTLSYDTRQKSRFLAKLDSGREAGVVLPRGSALRDGDYLQSTTGEVVRVQAKDELLSVVESPDALLLARAAYHLGNRHVPVELAPGRLAYQHDHVLDDLLKRMGFTIAVVETAFEPERGAYHSHGHEHSHGHGHSHGGDHDHVSDTGVRGRRA